ncbi:prepilin-type N-terminal cleavage/methylation domain-containing protein [Lichenicoccus sp.]|uniref:prepilin-type N-terminal cleavage/methylation domain-containing protein n=1 Tax=Lichenicoccus sp. TaxID=2781899 RepID=UPI003D0CEC25
MRYRGDAGFTLLEIIVALVVLGVLLATLSQGVHFGFAAWGRQNQSVQVAESLQATDRTLRRLAEQIEPGTERDAGKLIGEPHAMALTSTLPIGPDGAMAAADISLMVDHDHQLILSWLPHVHAQRLVAAPPPHVSVLLSHVDTIDLGYWSDSAAAWSTSWDNTSVPDLIRIRIVFPAHDKRHWPDIVAAPIRQQPTG